MRAAEVTTWRSEMAPTLRVPIPDQGRRQSSGCPPTLRLFRSGCGPVIVDCMSAASVSGRRDWPRWVLVVASSVALAVVSALGTFGWFLNAFGIGSDCTDKFSCGSGSCSPCAAAHLWVWTGGIGQWFLLAAAVAILVLGLRNPAWRRAATLSAGILVPLAAAWYALTTSIAQHSY